jgi:hypothetical protein
MSEIFDIRLAREEIARLEAELSDVKVDRKLLEAALKDAVEWNWITSPEDVPDDVQKRVLEALHPLVAVPSALEISGDDNGR